MRVALVEVPVWTPATPPLNIAYLSAFLKERGFDVSCFDLNIELFHLAGNEGRRFWDRAFLYLWQDREGFFREIYPTVVEPHLEGLAGRIAAFSPHVVGISAYSLWFTLLLSRVVKEKIPSVKVVAGGQVCFPLFYGKELLKSENMDAIVRGEGELPFLEYLNRLGKKGGGPGHEVIGGVLYKEGDMTVEGGAGERFRDLDALPFPDYSDLDLRMYTSGSTTPLLPSNSLSILLSRGCPRRCDFCLQKVIWEDFRTRSPENLMAEIEKFHEIYGTTFFQFNDLLINGREGVLERFSKLMFKRGLPVRWGGDIAISKNLSLELFRAMKRGGCEFVVLGIESASNRVLRSMGKGYTADVASRVLRDARRAGLRVFSNFIVGHPSEGGREFQETLDFLASHRDALLDPPTFSLLIIQQGTPLYERRERYGVVVEGKDALGWRTRDGGNDLRERKERMKVVDALFRELYDRPLTFTDIESEGLKIS